MYVAFFGYYPIIKSFIEKKSRKISAWIIKYLIFNVSMVVAYFVVSKIFMITFDDLEGFGKYAMSVLLLIGNILRINKRNHVQYMVPSLHSSLLYYFVTQAIVKLAHFVL